MHILQFGIRFRPDFSNFPFSPRASAFPSFPRRRNRVPLSPPSRLVEVRFYYLPPFFSWLFFWNASCLAGRCSLPFVERNSSLFSSLSLYLRGPLPTLRMRLRSLCRVCTGRADAFLQTSLGSLPFPALSYQSRRPASGTMSASQFQSRSRNALFARADERVYLRVLRFYPSLSFILSFFEWLYQVCSNS